MSLRTTLKRFKFKDFQFNNVRPVTAYTFVLFGMMHFIILGSNLIALYKVQWYNWGIYVGLGLDGAVQLEMTQVMMWIDAGIAIFGVYLMFHLEPEKPKKQKNNSEPNYGKDDYNDKDNLT